MGVYSNVNHWQIKTILIQFKNFIEDFGGLAKELIKMLDEVRVYQF